MNAKLAGKIALITGGTTGIGHETARLFRDEGATVIVTGTNPANIERAQASLGPTVEVVRSDSTQVSEIQALMDGIQHRHGRLDVVFVNAGMGSQRPIEAVDEAYFDHLMALNLRGVYFTVQRALPLMPEHSAIILTSSVAAHVGAVQGTVYAASKAAVRSLGRSFAAELTPRKIRVNTLTPGPIETPLMGKSGAPVEMVTEMMRKMVPMARIGQPIEVATAALFLASSDSSFMTAAEVVVAGGMTDV